MTNNSQKTYNELQILVNDVSHLQAIMGSLCLSDNLLFVFTSVLSKSILNGEFSTVKETCSEENISSLSEN